MSRARALDQFYTSPGVARFCVQEMRKVLHPSAEDLFLEPSAGDGAFLRLLPTQHRLGLDLDPGSDDVLTGDFFEFVWPFKKRPPITVGNPPFGKNASLAVRFFNHAATFSRAIAFIVPKTFRKQSVVRRLAQHFHCILDLELPRNAFLFEGKSYDVPCCFQVWERRDTPRTDNRTPTSHDDFSFVDREGADFAFRRVGGLAGKIIRKFEGYSAASHYFIKSNIGKEKLIARLAAIDWTEAKANNAGNPSISKAELVAEYDKEKRRER